jgi:hypothetical protein
MEGLSEQDNAQQIFRNSWTWAAILATREGDKRRSMVRPARRKCFPCFGQRASIAATRSLKRACSYTKTG